MSTGLAYNAADLPGSIFVNNFIYAMVDATAALVIIPLMERINRRTIIGPCFAFCALASGLCGYFFYVGGSLATPARWISFCAMFAISAVHSLLYVYVAEVFPTQVRSLGTAFALFGDEIGETLAPFVLLIDNVWVCYAIFGAMTVLASISTLFLIETFNRQLPETLGEMKITKRSDKINRVGVLDMNMPRPTTPQQN